MTQTRTISLTVNGQPGQATVDTRLTLYDEQGQCLASSFLDYPRCRASRCSTSTTPSPINPLGVKGAGEAGTLPVSAT